MGAKIEMKVKNVGLYDIYAGYGNGNVISYWEVTSQCNSILDECILCALYPTDNTNSLIHAFYCANIPNNMNYIMIQNH